MHHSNVLGIRLVGVDSQKEARKHQRQDGHELDQDVQARTACVLERIADGVAHHCRFVYVGAFPDDNA